MRNFELDKTVTLREVLAALKKVTAKASKPGSSSHEIYAGDLGYIDVDCDNTAPYEGFTEDVLQELL